MYLYGASGHAKVIIDILEANNVKIDGLFDDNKIGGELMGYPISHYCPNTNDEIIISIGNNEIRKRIAEQVIGKFVSAIHPSAIISLRAKIGKGSVVMHGAIIQSDAIIGEHCIINTGATVDHDCIIDNYVHVSPNATLCGNVRVGEGTQIGAGAVVVPGVTIGKWTLICAGSVVAKDIPDYCVASGDRCKVIRYLEK